MNKSKGKKKNKYVYAAKILNHLVFFIPIFFIVDICPSSHPFSVNMGRVCCQTHSSKVSIKVMYFFQNDVEKNPAISKSRGLFCNICGKKNWIYY